MSVLRLFLHDPKQPLLFNSGTFYLCFVVLVAGYLLLVKRDRARVGYVLLFSAYYYYRCNGLFALALLFTSVTDYQIARALQRATSRTRKRQLLLLSLALSLGILGYFKYANFALGSFAWLTGTAVEPLDVFLPIGISFYTFQSISYVVDVYRGDYEPSESFVDYAFYLSFFPQIVAGPIVRAAELFPQIRRPLALSSEDLRAGLYQMARGLAKKALLADYIGSYCDLIYLNPQGYTGPEVALAVYGYAFQIYFDFSGYSDMAIGMARVLGFQLPDNFNAPYQASNITAFWQRWHMSLSTWLRDYLYISLGGNRCQPWRRNVNLMLTMLLGGLWHGAAWTFVAWGGLHGAALIAHKWYARQWGKAGSEAAGGARKLIAALLTFHFVALCWILFRASSFSLAAEVFGRLGSRWDMATVTAVAVARRTELWVVVAAAITCALPVEFDRWIRRGFARAPMLLRAAALLVLVQLVVQLRDSSAQPFIYFQF